MAGIVTLWLSAVWIAYAAVLTPPAHAQDAVSSRPAAAKPDTPGAQSGEVGLATVYEGKLEGQLTASGESYRAEELTAAHRTYPLGTRLRVIAVRSGKTVTVRVNDRWGGGSGRVINLSGRAARELGFGSSRSIEVRIEVDELGTGRSVRRETAPSSVSAAAGTTAPQKAAPSSLSAAVGTTAPQKATSRAGECAEQAKILGLEGDWAERHVRACLANRPKN